MHQDTRRGSAGRPERAFGPDAGSFDLAIGELVADLGVCACELSELALHPVALGADLARVAELRTEAIRAAQSW